MILAECLPNLGKELREEILKHAPTKVFSADDYIVRQGQVIRSLPLVIEGSLKVFSIEQSMEFLLYYITAGETCIFSFAHIFDEAPIHFSATAEVQSEVLLLPIDKVREWHNEYPRFNNLLINAYQKHYNDLLQTTKQIMCYGLEERLIDYLKKKAQVNNTDVLKISHQSIANDLGTSREVITRLMKKLNEHELVTQQGREIKISLGDKGH